MADAAAVDGNRCSIETRGSRRSFWREISAKVRCGRSYWWAARQSISQFVSHSISLSFIYSLTLSISQLRHFQTSSSACALHAKVRCLSLSFWLKVLKQLPLSQLPPLLSPAYFGNYATTTCHLPLATCHTHCLPQTNLRTHPQRQPPATVRIASHLHLTWPPDSSTRAKCVSHCEWALWVFRLTRTGPDSRIDQACCTWQHAKPVCLCLRVFATRVVPDGFCPHSSQVAHPFQICQSAAAAHRALECVRRQALRERHGTWDFKLPYKLQKN